MPIPLTSPHSFSLPTNHFPLPSQSKPHFHNLHKTPSPTPLNFPKLSCHSTTPLLTPSQSDQQQQQQDYETEPKPETQTETASWSAPVRYKRKRYRKEYPGEAKGITEELRFVAMKLKVDKGSTLSDDVKNGGGNGDGDIMAVDWEPSMEGFVKYLVDTKLVFDTIERIVEDSTDVSYAYFRKTGLERSESLAKDLEWFSQQGIMIPEPSDVGRSYAAYLKDLGEKSAPLFLSHFYNVYFSHIAGGQVIATKVAEKILEGKGLESFRWEGDTEELLKEVRDNLNRLSEHWSRDDKNKCLREATKSFKYLGQMVRFIIL